MTPLSIRVVVIFNKQKEKNHWEDFPLSRYCKKIDTAVYQKYLSLSFLPVIGITADTCMNLSITTFLKFFVLTEQYLHAWTLLDLQSNEN